MRALRLDQDKRIYFPKRFNKKACPKLELIEGLLDKRIKLKKALELEKAKMEKLSADTKTSEDQLKLICYSPDCRDLQAQDKQSNLRCYSHDCRKESGDFDDEEKENSDEEKQKEISEVSYCVKPVYLYNVNERNEIQRKLNAKRLLGKGQLPPCSRFVTKSGKKSIFVLPSYELRKLGRSAALREVCGFSYTAKSNSYIWPFHSTPRPLFKTCWSYRNSIIEKDHGLESVALSLRIIWHCIRWDDMANKPLSNTITTETDIITTELLKRRDLAPFGIRSEYLVRKIIVPIEFENEKDDNEWRDTSVRFSDISTSSKREGLRERKKKFDDSELRKQGPSVTETWTAEEELQLWEIRGFGEKLEKQQQMIKEREKERIQKENLERARKLQEERQREERSKKLLSNEKARVSPIIQKTGQIKRVLATQQNNNASNQQSTQGFAMIRTLGGQTYRIPVSALQGKKLGQQIVIKTGNPNSGQFTYTTKATIISTNTQPIATNTPQNSNVTTTNAMQITPHSTVRPLILSSSGNATNLATGISASSLHQQNAATPHKIQFVKQISTPTVSSQPISTVTTSSSASTPLTAVQQPSTVAQPTTTIKILPSALLAANGNANSNNPLQLAIKMPDGRLQLIQLPASMLNSTQPIQIAIPQQTSSASSTPTTNIVSQTTTSTPTNQIMRTIQTSSPSPQIIRAVAPSSNSSPTIIRTVTPNSQVIRTITSTLNQNSTIRTITPVAQPILRTASTTSTNTSIVQKSQPIKSTPAISSTSNNSSAAVSNETTATTIKTLNKRSIAATIENSPVQKPLLQHQLLDDQLNQSDSQIKIEESSFKLTPQYKQEIVKAALSSRTNTPEITQKLLALQKHTQQQANNSDDNRVSNIPPTNQLRRSTAGGLIRNSLNSRNNLTNRHSSQSRILNISNSKCLEEERDDIVVKTIIKAMIDKIEKDEKLEQRRKKARENQLQTKWRQSSIRQNAKLNKNADLLKKEMLKIRAMYQREVKESVKQEINGVLKKMQHETSATTKNRMSGENSQDCPDLQNKERTDSMLQNSNSKTSGNAEFEPPAHNELGPQSKEMAINRAPSSEDCVNSFSSSSKRKSIASIQKNNNNLNNDCSSSIKSSTSSSSTNNLIKSTSTNQTTNNKRKSLTSDQIGNLKRRKLLKSNHLSEHQFHDQFSTMDESGTNKQKRLYCICKQAYDSKRFMIGCDLCHDWFHISCLNLAEDKVKTMSSFICQNCRDTHGSELDDEEFLDEEDDELVLDEEEQLEEDNESNSNQLIISEPSNQQLPKAERLSNCDNSLIDNSKQHNSKDLVQKVSPSSKRKATSNNVDSNYSNKVAVVQQAVNGVKAIRKKQTTTSASKPAAKQAKQEAVEQDNELYCICRTPYNESQFYVQCEKCDEWLHGKCIGLLSKEAEKIDVYLCPTCDHTSTINYANQKELDNEDYEQLRRLLKSIQQHKNAWPFLRPVDERQVPDYYNVIKDPMDLSSIETNLNKHGYSTLTSFIGHITQIFDNCHYYNDAKSSIVSCANNLENFFVQKLSQFRQQMIR